ncbi:MAG TPA: hypothetical protein VEK38_01695 [Candidatus Bathyarchaeia archaeon]|nr:hypothetical protein [Candidatus Bathyarchaeia archaeon]
MRLLKVVVFLIPLSFYAADKNVALDPATVVAVMENFCANTTMVTESGEMYKPSPLELAVEKNMSQEFSILLQVSSVDINKKDQNGSVLLHRVIYNIYMQSLNPERKEQFDRSKEIAKMIIDHKDFDQKKSTYIKTKPPFLYGKCQTYPLDWALQYYCFDLVRELLKCKDVIYSSRFLMNFAKYAHVCGKESCDILMRQNPHFLQKVVVSSIEYVSIFDNCKVSKGLQFLVDTYTVGQKILDHALYRAVKQHSRCDAQYLIQKGAEANHHNKKTGNTMLVEWAMSKYFYKNFISLLDKTTCDPLQQKNNQGDTPLHVLFDPFLWVKNHEEKIDAIRALGIDFHMINNKGQTPLHVFAEICADYCKESNYNELDGAFLGKKITECLKYCKKIGIDQKIRDKEGKMAQNYVPQCLKKCFDNESESD